MDSFSTYALGALTTIAGSWIAIKIHSHHAERGEHRDKIKRRVLELILNGVKERCLPLASRKVAVAALPYGLRATNYLVQLEQSDTTRRIRVVTNTGKTEE